MPTTRCVPAQCPVSYGAPVATTRKTPQRTVAIDDELWNDVMAIAKLRREKVSDVIRRALVDYRETHRALLDADRDRASD